MSTHFIAADLVKVFKTQDDKKVGNLLAVLAWGDPVDVVETGDGFIHIRLDDFREEADGGIVPAKKDGFILTSKAKKNIIKPIEEKDVLQVSFVDVQQGDGCVIETPNGKVIIIDGGENQLFARYLAARFQGSSASNPKVIDCIVVSHGDADHFVGLPKILESEGNENARKRLFINPRRVFHNGIPKRPGTKDGKKRPDTELLGDTDTKGGKLFLTGLYDNLLDLDNKDLNKPFNEWKAALQEYQDAYGEIEFRRLDHTSQGAFDFLGDDITVDVLGPITEKVKNKPALKFLKTPSKSAAKELTDTDSGSMSASHTINGHSVILRFKYGNFRFFFAGDLNEEAEDLLVEHSESGEQDISAEVLKVPHHGSADFSTKFLAAVKPMISVVSSGDENEQKEFIHPRATLVGALGRHSSIDRPLIFITELVAFFKKEGMAKLVDPKKATEFFGFSRSAFGVVHVRTDGKRILVFTHSGKADLKEAYAYTIGAAGGTPEPDTIVKI